MSAFEDSPPVPPLSTLFPHLQLNASNLPANADPFTVTTSSGFLPASLPLRRLPSPFEAVTKGAEDMPVVKENGEPGLLAQYKLGPLIDSGVIPDLTSELDNLVVSGTQDLDLNAITAAFRDYSFLASAYLLEPCWEHWNNDSKGGYGLGREVLPACIARPLVKCAEILDIPPFMSYAASYALYNYHLVDESRGHDDYKNLRLIRGFEKGLDPTSSEAGFILTHIHMVAQTSGLIEGTVDLLDAIEKLNSLDIGSSVHARAEAETESGSQTKTDRPSLRSLLQRIHTSLEKIDDSMAIIERNMEKMWSNSLPKDYISYRTFIFGITSQSMFPNGVVYEGCFIDPNHSSSPPSSATSTSGSDSDFESTSETHRTRKEIPQFFRGESGANDSIIPLLDHLFEIPMPTNPLTQILKEFRQYRPKPHRQFLSYVLSKATELNTSSVLTGIFRAVSERQAISERQATSDGPAVVEGRVGGQERVGGEEGDTCTSLALSISVLHLRILDHVRSFRWRHWQFAREYIIKRTSHPTATGGSPIVTWLPNQLGAVMDLMERTYEDSGLEGLVDARGGDVGIDARSGDAGVDARGEDVSIKVNSRNGRGRGSGSENRKENKQSGGEKPELVNVQEMMRKVRDQKEKLGREVKKYCEERGT